MIESLPDFLFPPKSFEEDDVALEVQMRHLESDQRARLGIDRLEDRGHAAVAEQLLELVLIEPIADEQLSHAPRLRSPTRGGTLARGARGSQVGNSCSAFARYRTSNA
jgi:hypothetical protein